MSDQKFAAATASGLTKNSVEKLAESVAKQVGYDIGGNLEDIVEKLGGDIQYKDFWNENTDSGSTEIRGERDFTIFLSWDTSQTRDRFTLAHELGHYVLHFLWPNRNGEITGPVKALRYGSDRTEWEANWFAAAFLMPESDFRNAYKDTNGDITEEGLSL
ncbi:ImmA/IrrE family metallo-endopeptidase [Roseospira navarrensis]|uniref:ImmA/IrrE family metallo-endopeptidase n=1 Tax=Roseospira navarrensis TaxID=140058 RepID=A0A7X1ZGB4_9PROT|nr:ImmA/IrrE family metallo-endopeptidase [Roseospira navarrensis]MQX36872.1 ImmA/IrrE family metallo-endopeptidase [Roseospira navarrensis]